MPLSPEIADVLERHLVPGDDGRSPDEAEPSLGADLLDFAGFGRDAVGQAAARSIETALADGFAPDTLAALIQAYARGLGRIVAAESDAVRNILKAHPPAARNDELSHLLSTHVPLAHGLFQELHRVMLRDALADTLTDESLDEPESPQRVVALVDLCDSTPYLTTADRAATQQLVDALFDAGQAATAGRAVWAVKYVGDGVFLVGRSAHSVVEASARAVEVLESSTPLRARAGIASGAVVRRAGDYFGPPVNLAQRLTTQAEPGTLLVAEPVAARLDGAPVSERREVEVRGFDQPVVTAVIRP